MSLTEDVDALRIEHAGRQEEFASAVRETAKEMGINQNWLKWRPSSKLQAVWARFTRLGVIATASVHGPEGLSKAPS